MVDIVLIPFDLNCSYSGSERHILDMKMDNIQYYIFQIEGAVKSKDFGSENWSWVLNNLLKKSDILEIVTYR